MIKNLYNKTVYAVSMYTAIACMALALMMLFINPIITAFIIAFTIIVCISEHWGAKEIKIQYFVPGLEEIQKIKVGDWIDLRAGETVQLKAGEYRLLRLGVGMILPDGYEAHVLPRSSTPSKFGIILANSMGVIDNSYSGDGDEWRFPALAFRDTIIEKGDRICQFRIVKNQPAIRFTRVFRLNEISRGGIGSTGRN